MKEQTPETVRAIAAIQKEDSRVNLCLITKGLPLNRHPTVWWCLSTARLGKMVKIPDSILWSKSICEGWKNPVYLIPM